MSWNNALPIWLYELDYQHHMAKMSGCMESEWIPEWAPAIDAYLYKVLTRLKYYE